MQKRYAASRRGVLKYVLPLSTVIPLGTLLFSLASIVSQPIGFLLLVLLLLPVALIAWVYFDTYYAIEQTRLRYKCAFLRGVIDIQTIHSVQVGTTMWVGLKPALATGGLIIHYGWHDEIYLAPDSNDELITDLLAIKPTISIIRQSP